MLVKEFISGVPLASLLWLAPLTIGCGHAGTSAPPPTTAKGYHATAPATQSPATQATPAPPAPAAPAPARVTLVSAPMAPAAAPPVVAQPATLAPPRRPYEPPMPLEPGKSTSVVQPLPSSSNGANTTATGQRFSVQGVDPSDVLNIRSGPSPTHEVVGTIPPDGSGVIPVGGRRQLGPSVWREVSYRGVRGWVNDRFLVEERANQPR